MRPADEGHDHVLTRRLVQQHLGVTGSDDLTAGLARDIGEQAVYLTLAENLEMRVGLVEEQNGSRIRVHVREQEQGLLQATSG